MIGWRAEITSDRGERVPLKQPGKQSCPQEPSRRSEQPIPIPLGESERGAAHPPFHPQNRGGVGNSVRNFTVST